MNDFYYSKKRIEEQLCRLLAVIESNKGDKAVEDALQGEISEYRNTLSILSSYSDSWLPTPGNINALPDSIRKYIHDLETNCDPAGMVQENVILKENCKALELKIRDLELRLKDLYKQKSK